MRLDIQSNGIQDAVKSVVNPWERIGDNASELRHIPVEDVKAGISLMPMTQLLHNLYTQSRLFIDADRLVLIKTDNGKFNGAVNSVPPS